MIDKERILEALKIFNGNNVILYNGIGDETVTFQDVVDYVVQLQSENERLNDIEFTKEHCDLYAENEWLKQTINGYVADQEVWVSGYQSTQKENELLKAEIERLTEELEVKKKECREIADDYQEMGTFYYNETVKTAELQKQVDELTVKVEAFERTDFFKEAYIAQLNEENQQAVKDTAKEIAAELLETKTKIGNEYYVFANNIKVIAKRKGVEVE